MIYAALYGCLCAIIYEALWPTSVLEAEASIEIYRGHYYKINDAGGLDGILDQAKRIFRLPQVVCTGGRKPVR